MLAGKPMIFSHALFSHKGGCIIHCPISDISDKIRASILKEASQVRCVEIEPPLQPLTEEVLNGCTAHQDDNSRLHFSIRMCMIYQINLICFEFCIFIACMNYFQLSLMSYLLSLSVFRIVSFICLLDAMDLHVFIHWLLLFC